MQASGGPWQRNPRGIRLLFSCQVLSDSFQPQGLQHARLPCPSLSPGFCSDSCPLSQWSHRTISFSVVPFSCLQYFPASVSWWLRHALDHAPEQWAVQLPPDTESPLRERTVSLTPHHRSYFHDGAIESSYSSPSWGTEILLPHLIRIWWDKDKQRAHSLQDQGDGRKWTF